MSSSQATLHKVWHSNNLSLREAAERSLPGQIAQPPASRVSRYPDRDASLVASSSSSTSTIVDPVNKGNKRGANIYRKVDDVGSLVFVSMRNIPASNTFLRDDLSGQ